jgi:hypothetical protein
VESSRLALVYRLQVRHSRQVLRVVEVINQELVQLVVSHREIQPQRVPLRFPLQLPFAPHQPVVLKGLPKGPAFADCK